MKSKITDKNNLLVAMVVSTIGRNNPTHNVRSIKLSRLPEEKGKVSKRHTSYPGYRRQGITEKSSLIKSGLKNEKTKLTPLTIRKNCEKIVGVW